MTVGWACGHRASMDTAVQAYPRCPVCGSDRVTRVDAPAPRFTGVAQGPSVTPDALPAIAVDLAPGGALRIKETR
jgi:hypothetical protein